MKKVIKLYGEVDKWGDVSHRRLSEQMSDVSELEIRVHSPGGNVFEGWAIFNLLQSAANENVKIKFYIDGIAASMMSFIIQAGHEVWACKNSMLMLHAPSGYASGTAKKMGEAANVLEKIEKMMIAEYSRRSGKTEKEAAKWMDGDNWFTPEEALAAGLIDGIAPAVATRKMDPTQAKALSPQKVYETYAAQFSSVNPIKSKMESVNIFLGLAKDAGEQAVISAITAKDKQIEALQSDLNKIKEQTHQDKCKALVEGAIKEGKVPIGAKDQYLRLAVADYETTESLIKSLTPVKSVSDQLETTEAGKLLELSQAWDKAHQDGSLPKLKETNPTLFAAMNAARWGKS